MHELGYERDSTAVTPSDSFKRPWRVLVGNDKKTPVVIVDETHLLSRKMLEENWVPTQSADGLQ